MYEWELYRINLKGRNTANCPEEGMSAHDRTGNPAKGRRLVVKGRGLRLDEIRKRYRGID